MQQIVISIISRRSYSTRNPIFSFCFNNSLTMRNILSRRNLCVGVILIDNELILNAWRVHERMCL